ncbi:2OG-Fe(II) oxygenase [Rhizobiales bacterium]|uniref:2OG-Fe(II) oxygenase n=1 Tax=Hongsoonwoonella zoysiae TaxID=2821844 RepID=UPI001560F09F|nr:2OG-Fe(II) oxygenase [Hongsoonwoonella zoysiae]NRG19596.1 2OG-Fe(II) oxygenase [Hongsoonwoonella zoysiae]
MPEDPATLKHDILQTDYATRVNGLDWPRILADLDTFGFATTGPLLTREACEALACAYDNDGLFRTRIVMARHGFGSGEYKYLAYPLPSLVQSLRSSLYPHLAPLANSWSERTGRGVSFPSEHSDFLKRCHDAGQTRPTPLLLRYRQDDFNCLHQDLYGDHVFPLQAAFLLSEPGKDFTGGEFVLTEQRPRQQSRASVVPLSRGEAVIFAVNERPVEGTRGTYRVRMRHGVSRILSGNRHTLGVIFHDGA